MIEDWAAAAQASPAGRRSTAVPQGPAREVLVMPRVSAEEVSQDERQQECDA
jgi:hypothetical protein